ncbi:MAG: hypothetical protein IH969_03780, partial [Candidatus Krumholzibacteriota bacterium]|nr:hypothetical protein [Candidatus Krumholzibacteriota bacterium]
MARTSAGTPHICPVARPVYPNQFASAHFVVHYASSGGPLYAQAVSEAAEKTYRVLIDTLAYVTPPSDGSAGGDSRTDIYVRPVAEMGG